MSKWQPRRNILPVRNRNDHKSMDFIHGQRSHTAEQNRRAYMARGDHSSAGRMAFARDDSAAEVRHYRARLRKLNAKAERKAATPTQRRYAATKRKASATTRKRKASATTRKRKTTTRRRKR